MAIGSVDGLVSGLDTTTIVGQLMALERQPQTRLSSKQSDAKKTLAVYQALNTKMATLSTAAQTVSHAADWRALKASSSATDAVTATATSAAQTGALSFSVQRLSRAGAIASGGTAVATTAVVATGAVLIAKGADILGFSALSGLAGLSLGSHSIEVTQATSGAAQTTAAALSPSTAIAADPGSGLATLTVQIDGAPKTYSFAADSFSPSALATAITTASGGDLTASIDGDGKLSLVTTHEGSTASLEITGGTAADLFRVGGVGPLPATTQGTDGALTVDGGTAIVVDSAGPGVTKTLDGVITATFGSGLRTGKAGAANVDSGDGSLASLVTAVNRAGIGISAAAVKVGTDSYRMHLASTTTGAASNVILDTQHLTGGLSAFSTVQSGRDAAIRVGEGAGAYEIASATDMLSDVLPGISLQLRKADPDTVVTVTVAQDGDALAGKVGSLVEAVNGALAFIKTQSAYDAETKTAGPLLSDGTSRMLQQQVISAVSNAVGSTGLRTAGAAGITVARDGTISFDKAKFITAYTGDPDGVASLFKQGGTATSGATFVAASTKTQAGTYDVEITQAAAQPRATGAVLAGGTITAAETISVRIGGATGVTASYAAGAGASLAAIAEGLNAAFAQKSLAVSAVVDNDQLVIRSAAYGSSAKFEVSSSTGDAAGQTGVATTAAVWDTQIGIDVKAKIDGGAEVTGTGQTLTVPVGSGAGGLALSLSAASGHVSFTYVPGIAQRLHSVAATAVDFGTGSLTSAISGRQSYIKDLSGRISDWDVRLSLREKNLRRQFSGLETALGKLKNQSSWLAGQLGSLPSNSG
jgi:flagellar hook-associated protein 2